jgi:hypothetical protein
MSDEVVAAERDDGVVILEQPDEHGIRYVARHPDGRTLPPSSLEDAMFSVDMQWSSRPPEPRPRRTPSRSGGQRVVRRPVRRS